MDSSMKFISLIIFFASSLFIQGTLGEIVCEELPTGVCAYSIASTGKRCLLENYAKKDGKVGYLCRTSEVIVERMAEYIENDQCVAACGVDRNAVGISSDALLEPQFTSKLCSPACFQNCHNIVDLYFNLAAGEGVYLPQLCHKQRTSPHRAMIELLSNGAAAGPISTSEYSGSLSVASGPAASSQYSGSLSVASGPAASSQYSDRLSVASAPEAGLSTDLFSTDDFAATPASY